ncbi:MAG: alpha-amylase [Deltaproteobacteria bacterium]|nr:alpha-amylase [Deltaproteobacteria bacterium]
MRAWLKRCVVPSALIAACLPIGACFSLNDMDQDVKHENLVQDWRDEMIYQILTDRFANGDTSNDWGLHPGDPARYHGGDWKGIEDHLDYVEALGVTTIWISPIVKNVDSDASIDGYHGYWTQDFTALNPHFGDMAALRSMVKAAHARNIKVVLDIVTNHIGQAFFYDINGNGVPDEAVWGGGYYGAEGPHPLEHRMEYDPDFEEPYVKARTSLGEAGPAPIIFVYDAASNHIPPLCDGCPDPGLFLRREAYHLQGRVWNWGRDECCYYRNNGLPVPPNFNCDPVKDLSSIVCDQVPHGDFPGGLKDLNTENPAVREALQYAFRRWMKLVDFDGFRIDTLKHVEHDFWKDFAPKIRAYAKDLGKQKFLMFGEAFTGFDPMLGSYVAPGEVDSVFYFSQKYTVFDGVFKGKAPTSNARQLLRDDRAANYDAVNPLEQVDGAGQPPSKILVNFLDNHDVARFLYGEPSLVALRQALAFLYTEDGIPCMYYGTEQNFAGGNDPANREDLWATSFSTSGDTFQYIRSLTALRKQHDALRRGDMTFRLEDRAGPGILAFERSTGNERVLVVFNTHDTEARDTVGNKPDDAPNAPTGAMVVGFGDGTVLKDVLGGAAPVTVGAGSTLQFSMGPREVRVLVQ